MSKKSTSRQHLLREMKPAEILDFVEMPDFSRACRRLAFSDDDLTDLQVAIMRNPYAGALIAGTGGLRKVRFAPSSRSTGKSSGVRVCYACFKSWSQVLLVAMYPKNEKSDLSAAERKTLTRLLELYRRQLEARRPR